MDTRIDWLFFVVMFSSLFGMIVSFILYFVNRNQSFSPRILALVIFSVSYVLFGFGLTISKGYLIFPFFWRTPVFLSICISPLTYLYVRSVLEQQFTYKRWDFLFFIPAVSYTMQFIPFYILPNADKIKIIQFALQDQSNIARETEAILPEGWGIMFRMFYGLVILIATYIFLVRWKKNADNSESHSVQNQEIYHWLFYIILVLSATYFIMIFEYLFQISRFFEMYRLMSITLTGTILFLSFYLILKPNILYGLKGWFQEPEPLPAETDIPQTEAVFLEKKKLTLTREQGNQFRQTIEIHFRENAPYLKASYAIKDLSNEVNIPAYQLSAFINQEYGKNFNEFVNDQRLDYLENLIKKIPNHLEYTLEALGQKAGFKSRTAFIAAVKRKTGKPPSELFGKRASGLRNGLS